MSSKRADDLPARKPSPSARNESPRIESSLEGQQPKNGILLIADLSEEAESALTWSTLADTSTTISQGNPPLSAQPVQAAIARTPKTVSTNLTSNGLGRHPLPTYDPSWSNPHRGPATKAYWRDPFHTRCGAWDGGSAPPDEGAFSSRPEADFDVMRRQA